MVGLPSWIDCAGEMSLAFRRMPAHRHCPSLAMRDDLFRTAQRRDLVYGNQEPMLVISPIGL
ncbi:hypothetical protein DC522_03105 [Microvirga sp. KLBC 81]|nr:hypothetical protein DC522_03105 [Microvirga sp. KLBC 81]